MTVPMSKEVVAYKQRLMHELLRDLTQNTLTDDQLNPFLKRFDEIFSYGYIQMHSYTFPLLSDLLYKDDCDAENLSSNLELIRNHIQNDNQCVDVSTYSSIMDLSDFINLEVQRFNTMLTLNESVENYGALIKKMDSAISEVQYKVKDVDGIASKAEEANASAKDAVKRIKKANHIQKESVKKISGMQTQFVTILAIFAAIIMTFSGGLSFISEAFTSISSAPIVNLVMLSLITGLIMFDVIAMLLHFVKVLNRFDGCSDCHMVADCAQSGNNKTKCTVDPYFKIINIILIAGITIDAAVMAIMYFL